jgi:hypothetical protein
LFTHKHTTEITTAAGKVLTDKATYEGESEENLSGIAANGDTTEFPVPIDVSKVVAFYIESDQDVTLHTNASPAGDYDHELEAGKALIWNTDRGANPITDDITSLFFVNDGDVDANIKAGFLLNL